MSGTLAVIQARMSSSRFPGKVLEPLLGMPLIVFMVQRVLEASRIDNVVVATSTDSSDDLLAAALHHHGLNCYRGNLHDVLDRFYEAAKAFAPAAVVRLTGDCPLIDSQVIDAVVEAVQDKAVDYASNVDPPTFPDGLDAECFTYLTLERAWREASTASQREHVTPYIREKGFFSTFNVRAPEDMSHLRWTVDYEDDLRLVRTLIERAGAKTPCDFDRYDLYRIIKSDPSLMALNLHTRNEGYVHSLSLERERKTSDE